jgi:hypothetical protein
MFMRPTSALPAVAAVASTAVLLVALISISPDVVFAADAPSAPFIGANSTATTDVQIKPNSNATRLETPTAATQEKPTPIPFRPQWLPPAPRTVIFDDYDQIAALDAIRIALVEVGDGATYVWHRRDGSFSGTAVPTQSFKNRDGQPCRHIVVTLQAASHTRTTEGIACRLATGRWQLDG